MNVFLAKISIICWLSAIPSFYMSTTTHFNAIRFKELANLLQSIAVFTSIYPVFDVAAGKYIEK